MPSEVAGEVGDIAMEDVSPRQQKTTPARATRGSARLESSKDGDDDNDDDVESRADPDVQTTVTDLLDFTEYLPSDMVRSLTLIGKHDQAYVDASLRVDELTTTWGQLPGLAVDVRPSPVKLRADISEQLNRAVSARVFAHAEALRMSDNVNRHYHKAQTLLSKLQAMMDNYPTEEVRSPTVPRSPQMSRAKPAGRAATGGDGSQKIRRHRIPKITVPGEVLAPYDIIYDSVSEDSDSTSEDDLDMIMSNRRTPGPTPRIKLVTARAPKSAGRAARQIYQSSDALSAAAAANAAALLNPPPENAVIGSADAPWLRLTNYELARLRKRMKKNATWTPSETMVARELKALNRGPDAYREAKKKAEEEGNVFEPTIPQPTLESGSGPPQMPAGAISVDSVVADQVSTSNRGMKLNEAKKLKREALAKQAAEDAEESARKMKEAAKWFMESGGKGSSNASEGSKEGKTLNNARLNPKRKRDGEGDVAGGGDAGSGADTPTSSSRPQVKRTKTETPVPPPQHRGSSNSATSGGPPQLLTPGGTNVAGQAETPVPIPYPRHGSTPNSGTVTTTTTVPTKPPAETPVPLPTMDRRKSITPGTESSRRETRGDIAKRSQHQGHGESLSPTSGQSPELVIKRSSSRGLTPGRTTPRPESSSGLRPGSRGKAASQEPQNSLASDRPRRASTARNTPAPESGTGAATGSSNNNGGASNKQPGRRMKRPAPGVVSTTISGGNSAVGKRKAAPRKKAKATRREKGQPVEMELEEVDDEGNPIDPNEARYCLCNRVSFGTMIQCDNTENCKQEWFHLECVGLANIPARTTKWYCPDCRRLLNIGEKGEVNARGVRK